jgi:hypothetical protein
MSLLEDNPERRDPEHLGRVDVGSISLVDSGELTNSAMCRESI